LITQIVPNQILEEPKHTIKKLANNDLILKLLKCGFKKESNLVKDCGNTRVFSLQQHQITQDQRRKLKRADFCKFRFCITCNWRRDMNIQKSLLSALQEIDKKNNVEFIFLTLTVPNCHIDDLKATIQHMNKSFQRLAETKAYKKAVLGHFKALEILGDNTKGAEAHPHFHILLIVDKNYFTSKNYISQKEFLQMWRDATRNQNITQVDIRIIKPNKDKNATASAVAEMCKYPLKDTDISKLTSEQFEKFVLQLKGIRNINAGGNLKNILKGTEKMDNDLVHIDDEHNDQLWILLKKLLYEYRNEKGSTNFYLKEKKEQIENG
jgi:plasmid rolling circle replication initiator protein Rep